MTAYLVDILKYARLGVAALERIATALEAYNRAISEAKSQPSPTNRGPTYRG